MNISQPADWVGKPFIGFIVNAEFSDENGAILNDLIKVIQETFNDAVFCMPKTSLHVTLLDWVAPLVDYEGQDKDELFTQIKTSYDKTMIEVLASVKPITITFDELHLSPSTIYIVGHDNGEFNSIRGQFLKGVNLLPNTKLPPQLIHSSLARFTKPIDLGPVESFIHSKELNFTQRVDSFRLIRTKREPMLEFKILKRYELK